MKDGANIDLRAMGFGAGLGFPPSSLRSRPAVNARPAPVKITTSVLSSSANSVKVVTRAARRARFRAFSASGRFMVTQARAPSLSTRTMGLVTAKLLISLGGFRGPGIAAGDALPEALVPLRGEWPGPAEIEGE